MASLTGVTSSPPPSQFIALPRELRDFIYEELIFTRAEEAPMTLQGNEARPALDIAIYDRKSKSASLLLVNHQVRAEFMDAVYKHAQHLDSFRVYFTRFPTSGMNCTGVSRDVPEHHLQHVRHMELQAHTDHEQVFVDPHFSGIPILGRIVQRSLQDVNVLTQRYPHIEELTITMAIGPIPQFSRETQDGPLPDALKPLLEWRPQQKGKLKMVRRVVKGEVCELPTFWHRLDRVDAHGHLHCMTEDSKDFNFWFVVMGLQAQAAYGQLPTRILLNNMPMSLTISDMLVCMNTVSMTAYTAALHEMKAFFQRWKECGRPSVEDLRKLWDEKRLEGALAALIERK